MLPERSPWPSSRVSVLAGFLLSAAVVLAMVALASPTDAQVGDFLTNGKVSDITFIPQTEIPGSGLPALQPREIGSEAAETFLGTVLVGVYRYGVWLTITAAIFATMLGGLLWLLAGGNASRVDTAKRLIGSSLFGLVLAFTSYLILQGINPRLLELKLPKGAITKVTSESNLPICCKDNKLDNTYHFEPPPLPQAGATAGGPKLCRNGLPALEGAAANACNVGCCLCFTSVTAIAFADALCFEGRGIKEWCGAGALNTIEAQVWNQVWGDGRRLDGCNYVAKSCRAAKVKDFYGIDRANPDIDCKGGVHQRVK